MLSRAPIDLMLLCVILRKSCVYSIILNDLIYFVGARWPGLPIKRVLVSHRELLFLAFRLCASAYSLVCVPLSYMRFILSANTSAVEVRRIEWVCRIPTTNANTISIDIRIDFYSTKGLFSVLLRETKRLWVETWKSACVNYEAAWFTLF